MANKSGRSGVDSLLDALRKSGMNIDFDSAFGGGAGGSGGEGAGGSGGSAGGSGSGSGGSNSGGSGGNSGGSHSKGSKGSKGSKIPHFSDLEIETKVSEGLRNMKLGGRVVSIIVAILVIGAAYWWFHPPLNIQSPDLWGVIVFVCVVLFVVLGGLSIVSEHKEKKAFRRAQRTGGATSRTAKKQGKRTSIHRKLCLVPVIILLVGALGWLTSQSFFPGNAAKYSSVLKTESLDFATDIEQVDYSQIPVIDHDAAEILGDKQMGTISEYVSQFEVDSLYSQINYKGKPVRVSPLNYADLFKWLTNREQGIPAYVVVDMTTQDAQVVRVEDIEGASGSSTGGTSGAGGAGIKYSASEPLARNIDRYVQLKYPFYMFDTKSFEIDEDGHPWWICPVQTRTIGLFGGTTISRVVLCDAVSGECEDIAIEDAPEWIDRAYPSDLLIQQFNWYGAYNNGWINSWLGQSGVVKTTPGTSGQAGYNYIVKDDDVWVYTGVTSATSDSSIIGFVLVNQRTQESHFYSVAGATEKSAMESAEGQVQNLRYSATFPILINVSNQPTYFMALKDSAGTVKKFAMLDIQRYQNVAVGDTVADCQKSYEALLSTNGIDLTSQNLKTAQGKIARMATAVIESNSHYYVTLEGQAAIYDFALPNMLDIVKYGVGDTISFTYIEGSSVNAAQQILSAQEAAALLSGEASAAGSSSSGGSGSSSSSSGGTTSGGGAGASGSQSSGGTTSGGGAANTSAANAAANTSAANTSNAANTSATAA